MKNQKKIDQRLKLQESKKSKLSKITFYLLRDFETTTSLSKKMKIPEGNISYYTSKYGLANDCDIVKIQSKQGRRNTSNRYHKAKKGKYIQRISSYRLKIEHLLTPFYGEKKLINLQGRSRKILEVFLEPEFIRKNIFNDITQIKDMQDLINRIYDFIDNFIWNFQDDVLNKKTFSQSADFDKYIDKEVKEISEIILKDIKQPENSLDVCRSKFYDPKFLADIISNFCSRGHIELLYENFEEIISKSGKSKDAFVDKISLFIKELDKIYDWGSIPTSF